jgi:hypothetical protein
VCTAKTNGRACVTWSQQTTTVRTKQRQVTPLLTGPAAKHWDPRSRGRCQQWPVLLGLDNWYLAAGAPTDIQSGGGGIRLHLVVHRELSYRPLRDSPLLSKLFVTLNNSADSKVICTSKTLCHFFNVYYLDVSYRKGFLAVTFWVDDITFKQIIFWIKAFVTRTITGTHINSEFKGIMKYLYSAWLLFSIFAMHITENGLVWFIPPPSAMADCHRDAPGLGAFHADIALCLF